MVGMKDFPADFSQPFTMSLNYIKGCHIRFFDDNIPFYQKYWRFIGMTAIATVVLPKTKEVEILIQRLATAWKTENLSDMQIKIKKERIKELNFGLSVFYWGAQVAIVQNLCPQLVQTVIGKSRQNDFNFLLPFGCVYPFDHVKNWGRYLLVYVLQSYSILKLIFLYLGAQCLLVTLCSQLSTEFALLREDIKNAVPMPNRDKRTDEDMKVDYSMTIEAMVKKHQELITLAHMLNDIFNRMVFIDLCFFAMIICFFAILLALSHDAVNKFTYTVSVFALLTLVYLFCYYCEMLKQESGGIAEAAYENPWYNGGTHYQKTIRFIIMRAQRPCYVTSLNYVPITLNTFTKVVSTTWSYFSLMMTMYGDT
ncbi:odorant receptor 4-like [Bicyclus anynana]|uniref:Odorant receptor n=1 Tax=Bicyclus anynana TaxID=110368 RepID=A0ABM3LTA8_BICAN|nr:odorant receptor 4-like [Bicyclus anynana]